MENIYQISTSPAQQPETPLIMIDEEIRYLMPPLSAQAYWVLETSILESGCRDALVLWKGILIDGHNRYQICLKHNIPYNTISMDFDSRDDAIIWIINTQIGRRNLTSMQLTHFRGLHYRILKKTVRNKDGINQYSRAVPQTDDKPENQRTAAVIAQQYKVSQNTILRDAKASQTIDEIGGISPEAKRLILTGEVKIDKKDLERFSSARADEIAALARAIEDGTFEKSQFAPPKPSADASGTSSKPSGLSSGTFDSPPVPADSYYAPGTVMSSSARNVIELMTGSAYHVLLGSLTEGETAEAKNALREFIDVLENLYITL